MALVPLTAILIYGILHSILAAFGFKHFVRRITGTRLYEGFYRLFYNIVSVITLVPVMAILWMTPSTVMWTIPMPWTAVLTAVQAGALLALVAAVLQADPLRFAGVSQALAYFRGEPLPLPQEQLQEGGFYGLVRHPLYLFSLLVLWPIPTMTTGYFSFAAGATLYFIIGSILEEKRLTKDFGTAYRQYQKRVPWLFPWPRKRI